MRINKFVAQATGMSRRAADQVINEGRIIINGQPADAGRQVNPGDLVTLDDKLLEQPSSVTTIMLNKPAGYVCSRNGQGSKTVYDLLPDQHKALKPVGRLDKNSSGLLLLTSDGDLANRLTHPSYAKTKIYEITISKALEPLHQQMISDHGITLEDGPSRLGLSKLDDAGKHWQVAMSEGRNRQIRRTFAALGYEVIGLHRTNFGSYSLAGLASGQWHLVGADHG